MIRSMTGYGRSQAVVDTMNITVELKSVNHRYFEFNSRVPRNYGFLDEKLKSYIGSRVSRGKVECYVSVENLEDDEIQILVNHSLAQSYLGALKELAERNELNLRDDLAMSSLARYNDIFTVHKQEADEEKIWNAVKTVAEKAVDKFIEMRETEGNKLKNDVLSRADLILEKVSVIEERSPETVKEYNDKLLARINEFLSDVQVDEQRLLTECAIFADKVAVAEETVRLRSHIDQLRQFLDSDEAVGRKTDFLVQEMNREANTIGSKAQDVTIARCVIDIKAEIEKIREQIQNIE
ncbi:MAG: YicC family protein [Clostridia bacterium]|nr:YicC family protein [Clostridia bacterium]